ncbi:lytic murein transglycosylase [Erwinia sp. OLTSP20]|uniref:lytic murein transglycosylase n=1 Tax=unclassified Erwinia TaxID=2622719 RepID=UPI000C19EF6E|nr:MULTISPECIES: lytic murein transglycosylase [unclassified Erwinia]PIJ51412.1 lytic murein transglycosylase [Erwinia sp. OAMSP11]PIJ73434.1 lytic murein transglycosylase [Erwinia sp. OLSSP12]PIJ85497.1 lytic murein transglycosylase [Erwinia sp. OLCASP19]PIJ85895.1 lytic murein transglycosylase [Erwinia sp. OLMTSP26]PIJ87376.1 lytic murein transglycosylase [Erwinia sp. OLMDSP33]
MPLSRQPILAMSWLLSLSIALPQQAAAHSDSTVATLTKPASQTVTLAQSGRDPAAFPDYVAQLKHTARQAGFSEQTIARGFSGIHFVDHAVSADRSQPEKKRRLDDYLSRVINPELIRQGRAYRQQYRQRLQRVSDHYGVTSDYIVALWAMESRYGTIQGKEAVISALATLAFEGRRREFFTEQLLAALKIIQQQPISAGELKGSWAGAMGQTQFMPQSYLRYGADGDRDGKIDIWNNPDDVFASTANYLASNGWQAGKRWGQQVRLPANFDPKLAGTAPGLARSVADWQAAGVTLSATRVSLRQPAWIILPDDSRERAYMVFDNFRTLMRWNRSYYFALSVGMMADALAKPASVSADAPD